MKIEINRLNYNINNKNIINIDSMNFEGDKIIGIIGPNGSGKTTLLKHLYRDIPSRNTIYIEEKDIAVFTNKEFSKRISVLTQFNENVEMDLRVEDIVRMGRYPHKRLLEKYNEYDEKIVSDVLRNLGLTDYRYRRLSTLSGGELQRVFMAKIFSTEPELIILDEPTNHLDIKYKIEFMEILKRFNGPVIVSLHDLGICAKYCDELIVLKNGKVFAKGYPKEILTETLLKEVYEIDYRVIHSPKFIIYY